jgi:hypothetical protein
MKTFDLYKGRIDAIVGPVRLSYMNVFKTRTQTKDDGSTKEEYSVVLLIPKDPCQQNPNPRADYDGCRQAIQEVYLEKFGKNGPKVWTSCLKDGDVEIDKNTGEPKNPGFWYISCSSQPDRPPQLVNGSKVAVTEQDGWVSGDWGKVRLTFAPFDKGTNKGVSAYLSAIQFVYKDEPFAKAKDVTADFDEVPDAHIGQAYDPFADE